MPKSVLLLLISHRTKESGIGVLVDYNGQHPAHETLEEGNIRDNSVFAFKPAADNLVSSNNELLNKQT